jgi:hypothetical protein
MKYYTALRFQDRPDLHMTLTYYGEGRPEDLETVVNYIGRKIEQNRPQQFTLELNQEIVVGYKDRVPALTTSQQFPNWIVAFVPDDWLPHVTCREDGLRLAVTSIAVMCKNQELSRWDLLP